MKEKCHLTPSCFVFQTFFITSRKNFSADCAISTEFGVYRNSFNFSLSSFGQLNTAFVCSVILHSLHLQCHYKYYKINNIYSNTIAQVFSPDICLNIISLEFRASSNLLITKYLAYIPTTIDTAIHTKNTATHKSLIVSYHYYNKSQTK